MSVHDAVVVYRRRVVAVVEMSSNRRAACRQLGIHHSTFYRWRNKVADPDAGRLPRRTWTDQHLEEEIVSFVLGHPGFGPRRVADELSLRQVTVSASRVWRVMVKHRINTRQLRYQLLAAHRQPHNPVLVVPTRPHPPGQLQASQPGELVQFDCFHVGSFKETRLGGDKTIHGQIWQYTAIDVASSWLWVELESSVHNPEAAVASKLAHRVAADLTAWNWPFQAATTDNGNEFRSALFTTTLHQLGVDHRFIRAGRPQTNGKAERVQGTLLEEFYQPTLIGYVQPSISGLRLDLNNYVHHYNWKRPHRGKWNQGQTPAQIIQPKTSIQK
jgi:transposase InsO family protein